MGLQVQSIFLLGRIVCVFLELWIQTISMTFSQERPASVSKNITNLCCQLSKVKSPGAAVFFVSCHPATVPECDEGIRCIPVATHTLKNLEFPHFFYFLPNSAHHSHFPTTKSNYNFLTLIFWLWRPYTSILCFVLFSKEICISFKILHINGGKNF